MQNIAVELKNIRKVFQSKQSTEKVTAVDNFQLKIKEGELVTLLGPSGCGKTTTLRMVAGFETATSGEIYLDGKDVVNIPANKRNTAMVFQSYGLFPHMTVVDNITYGLRFRKMSKIAISQKAEEIMQLVGLEGYGSRNPGELSGGQQQRVALARALIVEPKVLLFDEPLSNLDAKLRESMRDEIRKLQKRLSITSLYVTHDQIEAMSISDKIVVMNRGKIEQVGTPEEIYYYPQSKFVADFIGKVNFLSTQVEEGQNNSIQLVIDDKVINMEETEDLAVGESVVIVLRPESISLEKKGKGFLQAKVIRKTYLGSYFEYILDYKGNLITVHLTNPRHKYIFNVGEEVDIYFAKEDIHLIKEE
ncbi:ABC transporter ATP-binding protein [Halocella sp. SP3-1]|uniref:ABC transporter ATP-binding protein n=1 Tax=Halocella sp. SP3-1 TaxID=2382161 RepID=UPI0013E00CEC|nr:ABC transporter ATP-binding protein [Halocella sp. SP3-1]